MAQVTTKRSRRSSAATKKRRAVMPEDLLKFQLVSSPQISPDGRCIVFVKKHVGEKNNYVSNLWMVDTSGETGGGPPRQFTSGEKDSAPQWSPDGSRIAFVRSPKEEPAQIQVIDSGGGEARPLTKLPEGSIGEFRWSPDGKRLALGFRETATEWTKAAEKERKENGLSTPARVIDDVWYRLDGDGYFGAQRYQLYLVDTETGKRRKLYAKDTMGGFSFDFSPDGKQLVVATNRDKKAMLRPWKDELLRVEVSSGRIKPIADLPEGPKAAVRWAPDGKTIAFAGRIGGSDGIYSTENVTLLTCRPNGGGVRDLLDGEDYCLLACPIADTSEATFEPTFQFASDSKKIIVQLGIHGETQIASVPTRGGKLTIHTRGRHDQQMGNISRDGKKLALSIGHATKLAEVAVVDVKSPRMTTTILTDFNGPLHKELTLVKPESHWIKAEDGHKLQVWVIKPATGRNEKKSPALLEIHGGPHAQYGSGLFHEFQLLAAAGYTVFYSNPRGSKGYGRDHCAAIRGNWGSADWTDIQAVTRFMQQQTYVDSKRLGVLGGSYGGYMTNWVIGHTRDFSAAVSDRCVSNLVSMAGNSDFVEEQDDYFPGNFWDRAEPRWNQSPMQFIGNAKTPTLIIHSEGDLRCNIEQSEQVFAALKLLNVPTRLVRYPRSTSHGMSRQGPPDLRIHRLHQILDWFEKYLG
ncbi:MAG: S9 family peptidase [Planctomycetes bacterium]|nr:S9 family peptidase [Planctomycetota bacterium]